MFEVLNEFSGKLVNAHAALKFQKKLFPTFVILLISKDQVGKLVSAQSLLKLAKNRIHTVHDIFEVLNEFSGKLVNFQIKLKARKKWSPTVVILLVSNDHSGKLVNAHALLKEWKKLFPGFVALIPNASANDGIYVILTPVVVVRSCGTNASFPFWNVHLVAHPVSDNVIVYVHAHVYVCLIPAVRSSTGFPSHQFTVYAFAKYLFIFKVWSASVAVASRMISFDGSHLAYRLLGAVDHVVISLHAVNHGVEYHHLNTYLSLFGAVYDLILFHSTIIIAPVHHLASIVIDGCVKR